MQPLEQKVTKTQEDWTAAFEAAAVNGNLVQLKELCSKDYPASWILQEKGQIFRIACSYGHLEIIHFLTTSQEFLDLGHQWINLSKTSYHRGLEMACISGQLETVRYLVESCGGRSSGQKINLHDNDEEALMQACANGHLKVVEYLTTSQELKQAGHEWADIHARDEGGFHLACREGHLEIVKFLTTSSALKKPGYAWVDIHAKNERGFRWACHGGHLDVIKFLTMGPELKDAGYAFCGDQSFVDVHAEYDAAWEVLCDKGHWNVVEWLIFEYGIEETPKIEMSKKQYPKVQEYFRIRDEKLEFKDLLSPPKKVKEQRFFEKSIRSWVSRAKECWTSNGSMHQADNRFDVREKESEQKDWESSGESREAQEVRPIRRI